MFFRRKKERNTKLCYFKWARYSYKGSAYNTENSVKICCQTMIFKFLK